MIVLDTNVVSEMMRAEPDEGVVDWVDSQDDLFITAVTVAELLYGVSRLPEGSRRSRIALSVAETIDIDFDGRVLPFDLAATVDYARVLSERERSGRPVSMADALIAATAVSAGASVLATRNVKDFEGCGIAVVDPWTATPRR